ncbi:cell shape determination protein CcmA [Spirochaetia bacterium]|nr:cell shape determination protein CcmA [Spirochaetia bacterium]
MAAKKPVYAEKQGEFALNTIVGPGSFVRGDIDSGGFTRIDGSVKGNLRAAGRVVVGESARMRSSITGTNVTIGGVVDGNILASERLIVLPTALIIGDITTRRIEAAEGCLIHGKVRVCQTEENWERAKAEFRDKRFTAALPARVI